MIREYFPNDSMADGRLETCSMSGRLKLVIEEKVSSRSWMPGLSKRSVNAAVTLAVQQQSLCDVSETFQRGVDSCCT